LQERWSWFASNLETNCVKKESKRKKKFEIPDGEQRIADFALIGHRSGRGRVNEKEGIQSLDWLLFQEAFFTFLLVFLCFRFNVSHLLSRFLLPLQSKHAFLLFFFCFEGSGCDRSSRLEKKLKQTIWRFF
jgi:hypothetical protein